METIKKKCFKCNEILPLSEYYKHKQMGDGHLNKCKSCTRSDVNKREKELRKDAKWIEGERKRGRNKYHRLGYKDLHKPTPQNKKKAIDKYKNRYPEKISAARYSQRIAPKGMESHHWSYNKEHWKDVIVLHPKDHYKAHIYIVYDQERFMFRRSDNNELLDTKEKHLKYITYCIENKPD